ncbi:hypothetical protein AB1Y20_023522 [Prymnesium parvum]|uniref:Uncharacterized protein n=1 Tax=Prymnesium parvum TaxID=97485 RepID=A0AB34JEP8_PRYPA
MEELPAFLGLQGLWFVMELMMKTGVAAQKVAAPLEIAQAAYPDVWIYKKLPRLDTKCIISIWIYEKLPWLDELN